MRLRSRYAEKTKGPAQHAKPLFGMARPEGFEPPTTWFVARYSIQLSYGRSVREPVILRVFRSFVNFLPEPHIAVRIRLGYNARLVVQ